MSTHRAATIDDVARAAEVSKATVSNVLNHPERVLPATRQRVGEAIAALNYVPDGAARSLAAGRSATIGFVVADLTNSFFVDMVREAQPVTEEAGLKLLLADAGAEGEQQAGYLDVFEEARVAGILFAPRDATLAATRDLASRQVPIVLLNAPSRRSATARWSPTTRSAVTSQRVTSSISGEAWREKTSMSR